MNAKRLREIAEIRAGCLFAMVLVMCLPFLAIGSLMASVGVVGVLDQARANAATRRVPVTVRSSEVVRFQDPGGPSSSRAGGVTYAPAVEFKYEQHGQTLTSDRVHPVGQPGERAKAAAVTARYPAGSVAEAWMPDGRDAEPFLEKHWNPFVYAGVAVGAWSWAFCGFLLCVSGGWRWVGRAWAGAGAIGVLLIVLTGWAAWHMHTRVPAADIPGWMIGVWIAMAAAALLPALGAWLATRLSRRLATVEAPAE